jgi:hypothetical protein
MFRGATFIYFTESFTNFSVTDFKLFVRPECDLK